MRAHVIGAVINLIWERAENVEVRFNQAMSRDPKDDPVCLCAEQGAADFIITLNLKDFPQSRLTGKVVKPGEIL